MKMWKRITSLVLVLCMMLPMFCFSAGALDAGGETTVTAGNSVSLSGSRGRNHSWTVVSEDGDVSTVTLTANNSSATFATSVSTMPGTYIVTHEYQYIGILDYTDTFTIIVESALTVQAKVGTGDWQTISSPYTVDAGSLEKGGQIVLNAQASWSDGTAYEITAWNSNATGVATVAGGIVNAVAAGDATITATLTNKNDDKDTITVSFAVHVNEPQLNVAASINGDDVQLSGAENAYSAPETTLYLGDTSLNTATLAANATKSGTTYNVVWAVTEGTDKVSFADGTVTALAVGSATVTATFTSTTDASDIVTVTFPITVDVPRLVITAKINGTSQTLSGSDTEKTVGSTTSLLLNESARLAAAATKGSVEYSVAWSTGNAQVASVDANGNVRGVAEGSTTVTATLTSGSETITVAFPVEVSATAPTLDKNSVFFYLLRPGKSDVASDKTAWAPFGVGTLNYKAAQDSSAAVDDIVAVNPNIDDLIDDFPVPYFPDSDSYSNGYAQSMSKGTYPTFERTVNGKTVTYKYEGDTSAANAAITHTYSIRWDRVKKCDGANCEGHNVWVQNGKYTWHVDGTVIFPDLVTVSYKVQDPNDNDFHIVENVWQTTDFTYTRDPQDTISSITLWPTKSNKGLSYDETGYVDANGIEWEFDGWYLNAACTISVDSVSSQQLQAYATDHQVFFYGKYVPKTYTVTYVYASPSASNAVATKRYSVASVEGLGVPLPKAPNGKNAYFAGWYFYEGSEAQFVQMSPFISENKNLSSSELAVWTADADNERNMTIYAVYYTANTNTLKIADYDGLKTYTGTPQPEVIASVDSGTIFGAPAEATVSIPDPSSGVIQADVIQALVKLSDAELKSWDQTGFVLSQSAAADVASCPTVQGGYQFVYDGKVFYTGSGSHAHYIRFVLDAIESGNYYATPFLAKLSAGTGENGEPIYSEFVYGPAALVYIQ